MCDRGEVESGLWIERERERDREGESDEGRLSVPCLASYHS